MPSPLEPITTSGLDPMMALQSTLAQMQQVQAQPPVGPGLGGLGAVLAGLGSGLQGRPNPVLAQGMQQQQLQMQGLAQQANIAATMATLNTNQWRLRHEMEKDARSQEEKRLDAIAEFAKPLLQSTDPTSRSVGARLTKHVLTERRAPAESIAMVDTMTRDVFDPGKANEILKASLMGVPPDYLARKYGVPVPVIQSMLLTLNNDDVRKTLGLKTTTELQTDAVTLQNRILEGIEKQFKVGAPYSQEVYAFATEFFKKDLRDLKPEEWATAVKEWKAWKLQEAANKGGIKPVTGETLQRYLALSTAADNLKQILRDVQEHPEKLRNYMGYEGVYGFREWAQTRLPQLAGKLSPEAISLAFLEDQLTNIVIQARSGAAVAEHEYGRVVKELPQRNRDALDDYKVRAAWALQTLEAIRARMQLLGGPGGQAAMQQGDAAFFKYAAEIQTQIPLPEPPSLGQPKAKLPEGWSLPQGTR